MSRPLRVLVVDDDHTNQRLVKTMLALQGHAVDFAGNGNLAVAAVADGNYDIVLMDIMMPEQDGYEAARVIRELDGEKSQIPIIGLSAFNDHDTRQYSLAAGMNDFLTKPISTKRLNDVIEKWRPDFGSGTA